MNSEGVISILNFGSEKLKEAFQALSEAMGTVINWGSENIVPYITDLCSRIIHYEIATSVAWIIISAIVLIGVAIVWIVAVRKDDDDWYFGAIMLSIFLGTPCIVCIGFQVFDIIKCVYIPEQIIYNAIKGLLNTSCN